MVRADATSRTRRALRSKSLLEYSFGPPGDAAAIANHVENTVNYHGQNFGAVVVGDGNEIRIQQAADIGDLKDCAKAIEAGLKELDRSQVPVQP